MPEYLITLLPFEFWIAVLAMVSAALYSLPRIQNGFGLPLLAVIVTVGFWYVGDVVYNDYAENHLVKFTPEILADAWIQVTIFVAALALTVFVVHPIANADCLYNPSRIYYLIKNGADDPGTQETIGLFSRICWAIWGALIIAAFLNIGTEAYRYALSFLGRPLNPFVRGRVGSGALSAVFALAGNFHVLVASGFGLIAALSKDPRIRLLACVGCLMTWPYFLLNRTRNTMLAACVPGIIAWIFVRVRLPFTAKVAILCVAVLAGDSWLRFVMDARNQGQSVVNFFFDSEAKAIVSKETRHEGLNMYEELCWLSHFIDAGVYQPNNGKRYFAEIVNPVPRALWPGKPMIGVEYAVARGQQWEGAGASNAGIGATISTGLIGQGVDNFGRVFGPITAGALMAFWVVILARIDLHAASDWRLPLYLIGLVLTFNCGRDLTLLVLYPFFFGLLIVKWFEWRAQKGSQAPPMHPVAPPY